MAMGITQALKLQEGPISTLAQLPQQQIIAMAQQGRIPADMVSVIINEKAEMAQSAANMQAMTKPMPPSVTERNMAINAQAEAMRNQPQMQPQMMAMAPQQQMPMDAGISSLPVDNSMYKLAGGGIVAFDDGGEVPGFAAGDFIEFDDLPVAPRNLRSSGTGKDSFTYESAIPRFSTTEYRIDPVTGEPVTFGEYNRRLDARRAQAGIPPPTKKAKASSEATPTTGMDSIETLRAKAAASRASMSPENRALYDENITGIKRIAESVAPKAKKDAVPTAQTPVPAAAAKPPVAAEADKPKKSFTEYMAESGREIEDPAMAEIRAKLATMGGESQLDRQQARNMALLQAGLGIMAGTSPYALSNIGAGAMKGTEAYASSMKDIKAAEKDLFKMQADLARADQARKDGNIKAFEEYTDKAEKRAMDLRKLGSEERLTDAQISKMEADKQYLAGQLRQLGVNERLINAQINNLNKPGEIQQRIDAYKADPKAFAEAMRLSRPTSETGLDNLQFKLYQAAEAHVNNPVTLASEPKLSALMKKAKGGDTKAMEELEAYKDKLRREYIRRNTPPGGLRAPSANAGAGAGSVDANNPLLRGN